MSYVDVLREQIEEQLRSGRRGLAWIDANGPGIIREAMNLYLKTILHLPIPGSLTDRLADAAISRLHEATAELEKALKQAEAGIAFVGSPDRLREASTLIGDKVVAPSRDLAGTVTLGRLPSTLSSNWEDGEASEAYEHAVDGRSEAVTAIATYAEPISSALDDLADAIENFYLSLLAAVVGIVVAILGAVEAILSLAGVVTSPAAIVGAVAALLGGVTAAIALYQLFVTGEQTQRSISGSLSAHIPEWPRALA